ncbi:16S rRNA (guanine(527)-N(7))-methyltransferase RsmG [Sphingomonas sp. 1P08PE]|uniref:16S rRNA (guanine(527)-N(7))-methyltransferase RsmG n=1 Tax=Sphingomonas sp. 1P08PE TaxID=554122 RepID=UPI0039A1F182
MTEDDAQDWCRAHLSVEAFDRLSDFVGMVIEENGRQNLISPASIDFIWARHVVDSMQLMLLAGNHAGPWLDIGTGGGFPGIVLAIAGCTPITMVEPRRKRAEFLGRCVDDLGIADAAVACMKVGQLAFTAGIITARAVAPVEKLLLGAAHCATTSTRWLLPRGTVDAAARSFLTARQTVFHVEQSLTHPESAILVIEGFRR